APDDHRLEHAVADGEAVVQRGDHSGVVVEDLAVEPDHATSAPDATCSSRRAFSSVSSHSPSGSESQVIAPPVPRCTSPSSNQNVRMATFRSAVPRSASTQPMAPQYGPRGTGSSRAMHFMAASFGAPV